MAAASRDLQGLLAGLDPTADVAQRHIWLINIFDWLRGDRASPQAAIGRVQLLLDAIEARPELRERLRAWWRVFTQAVDLTTLLADYGFAPRTAFASELGERLRRKILPGTPETTDASDLFRMVLPGVFDAGWIALLDETQLARIGALLADAALDDDGAPRWRHTVMDAVTYCSSQVVAAGFSPELRLRMSTEVLGQGRPFHSLMADLDELREQMFDRPGEPRDEEALQAAFLAFRDRLDACRGRRRLGLHAPGRQRHLGRPGVPAAPVARAGAAHPRAARLPDGAQPRAQRGAAGRPAGAGGRRAQQHPRADRFELIDAGRQGDRAQRRDRRALHHPRPRQLPADGEEGRGRRRPHGHHGAAEVRHLWRWACRPSGAGWARG